MRFSTKAKVVNKYIIISSALLIIIPFFSWAVFSEFFRAMFLWDTEPYGKLEYFGKMNPFYLYPIHSFTLLQLILPVFPLITVIPFLRAKKLLSFSYTRVQSYAKYTISTILKYSLTGCTALFLAYLLYLFIGVTLLPMTKDEGIPRELFSEFLGKDFYNQHMVWYFIIEGFIKYYVFSFVYGLFAISISFLTSKNHLCILVPIAYYAILAILVAVLESAFSINILFLSPTYTLMSNARPYINWFVIFTPLIPPVLFSTFIICRDLLTKKKRNDVFAIT